MPLIGFLITFICICVVIYCVRLLLPYLGLPDPINQVVLIVVGLLCLLWLLNSIGVVGSGPFLRIGYAR